MVQWTNGIPCEAVKSKVSVALTDSTPPWCPLTVCVHVNSLLDLVTRSVSM